MAARLTAATTIIAVDVVPSRLALAAEVGATHTVNAREGSVTEQIAEITGGRGLDAAVEASGNPEVLMTALPASVRGAQWRRSVRRRSGPQCRSTSTSCSPTAGWWVTEGDSNPRSFVPVLADLVMQGRMPLEKLITTFPFERIEEAAAAAHDGSAIKPVLTFAD